LGSTRTSTSPWPAPEHSLASNMYALGELWVDAARMRRLVKERGVRVVAGYGAKKTDKRERRRRKLRERKKEKSKNEK
jgi:hypothetical protein